MIEQIKCGDLILGIIIRRNFQQENIAFFTPETFAQQLGYMNRPQGYQISPHIHKVVERKVEITQEVLFVKKGKVRIDFYDENRNYTESRIVMEGDVILLAYGGHGFQMLESSEIIEVKQGPYCGEMDKERFDPIANDKIVIKHK
jgi:hypothetical protein